MKLISTLLISVALTGCATHQQSQAKLQEVLQYRDKGYAEQAKRNWEIKEIIHRHERENRLAEQKEMQNLRQQGYVVCEKNKNYNACK